MPLHVLNTSQWEDVLIGRAPPATGTDVSAKCQRCGRTWSKKGLSRSAVKVFLADLRQAKCKETD